MATLYRLQGDYAQIQAMIEEGDAELQDTLDSIEDALEEKLEAYAMVIRNIESDIEGLKNEEKRLADRRKSMENGVKRMKEAIQDTMIATDNKKIKGEKFTFTIQKNPGSLKVVDETLIPKDFVTVETINKIDKKGLLALAKTETVAGVEVVQSEGLRIR